MKADKECLECCVKKVEGLLDQYKVSEKKRRDIMEQVEELIEKTGEDISAPSLMAQVMSILELRIGIADAYDEPKRKYNQFLMEREEEFYQNVLQSTDRFLAGIQYAITGNYIDFGAMSDVNEEKLKELLADYKNVKLDPEEMKNLRNEMGKAHKLVYITDNAGEIVLDKIFIKIIKI